MELLVWPAALFALGLSALLIFKRPITRLIDRSTGIDVSKSGLRLKGPPDDVQEDTASPPGELIELEQHFSSDLLTEAESLVTDRLTEKGLDESHQREQALLRYTASFLIAHQFELTYSAIFGSQIEVLTHLNSSGPAPVSEIRPIYDRVAAEYEGVYSNFSFDRWLAFLETKALVARDGDQIGISIRGRDFLRYLITEGRPVNKFF